MINFRREVFFLNTSTHSVPLEDREILTNLTQTGTARRKSEELLFKKYQYFVREGIFKYHLREEESLDAYCETILSFTHEFYLGHFEGRSSLKTYLYKIFINKCVDLIRKSTTNKSRVFLTELITDKMQEFSDTNQTILQKLINEADYIKLKEQMQLLNENCRKLLLLWAEDYSDKEIAALLEYKSANVVKTSRFRCLDRLKQLYKTG